MLGLDDRLTEVGQGGGLWIALGVALLLGLRHATDPDHLTAVSTLVLSDARHGASRAATLGLSWGAGHAVTLLALGVPVILFRPLLPAAVQTAAEVAIAALIVVLAARLLVRWHRGYFHAHPHHHGEVVHSHPHMHERTRGRGHEHSEGQAVQAAHRHAHAEELGRSPAAALGLGVVHGVGGSAGAGLLVVAAAPDRADSVVALVVFAVSTAAAMALCSAAFGQLLAHGPVARRLVRLVPVFGAAGVLFGVWYGLGALDTLPYVF